MHECSTKCYDVWASGAAAQYVLPILYVQWGPSSGTRLFARIGICAYRLSCPSTCLLTPYISVVGARTSTIIYAYTPHNIYMWVWNNQHDLFHAMDYSMISTILSSNTRIFDNNINHEYAYYSNNTI